MSSTNSESDEMIKCRLCADKVTVRRSQLLDHIRGEHFGHAPHQCQTCGSRFTDGKEAYKHAGMTGHVVTHNWVRASASMERLIAMNYTFCLQESSDEPGDVQPSEEKMRVLPPPPPPSLAHTSVGPISAFEPSRGVKRSLSVGHGATESVECRVCHREVVSSSEGALTEHVKTVHVRSTLSCPMQGCDFEVVGFYQRMLGIIGAHVKSCHRVYVSQLVGEEREFYEKQKDVEWTRIKMMAAVCFPHYFD